MYTAALACAGLRAKFPAGWGCGCPPPAGGFAPPPPGGPPGGPPPPPAG